MRIHLLSHIYNEELLLPGWLKHHAEIVDTITIIDHHSTDRSVEIIKELTPHANIIISKLDNFGAHANDAEVLEVESSIPKEPRDFTFVANTTEWIFDKNFRQTLADKAAQYPEVQSFGMRSVVLIDKEPNASLDFRDHQTGFVDYENDANGNMVGGVRRWRFIHNQNHGNYELGRHWSHLPNATPMMDMLLLYWDFAPYPDVRARKMQIQNRRTRFDIDNRLGFQHDVTEEQLTQRYEEHKKALFDLNTFPLYKERLLEYGN